MSNEVVVQGFGSWVINQKDEKRYEGGSWKTIRYHRQEEKHRYTRLVNRGCILTLVVIKPTDKNILKRFLLPKIEVGARTFLVLE